MEIELMQLQIIRIKGCELASGVSKLCAGARGRSNIRPERNHRRSASWI